MATITEQHQHVLLRTPFFTSLSEQARTGLLGRMELRSYERGAVILAEGAVGKTVFVLLSGTAAVTKGKPAARLTDLPMGAFFGEISAAFGEPAIASVVAESQVHVAALAIEDIKKDAAVWGVFMHLVAKELAWKLRDANTQSVTTLEDEVKRLNNRLKSANASITVLGALALFFLTESVLSFAGLDPLIRAGAATGMAAVGAVLAKKLQK